ncbi:MAG: hypothetical protein M3Y45_05550, partial [Actinomycetota bacterium]|nr:hypothetical protein [Actinomycetota bacterium]
TEGALPPARRRRRQPRKIQTVERTATLPLTVVTVVLASEPLAGQSAAEAWLATTADDDVTQSLLEDALSTLDRALAAAAATTGRLPAEPAGVDLVVAARIGFGEGQQVYSGRFIEAVEIDARGGTASPRRERLERIIPLPRIAAILGGRESLLACEVMIPRVRADLDAGRVVPAALTIHEAARATLVELEFAVEGPEHEEDLDRLEEVLDDLAALPGDVLGPGEPRPGDDPGIAARIESALRISERVIRRFRITAQ